MRIQSYHELCNDEGNLSPAWHKGYSASSIDDNPFEEGTIESQQWIDGYFAACADYDEKDDFAAFEDELEFLS